jgi:hypothetical protein
VALVEELARRGSMARLGVVPLLCGSAAGAHLLHTRCRSNEGRLA